MRILIGFIFIVCTSFRGVSQKHENPKTKYNKFNRKLSTSIAKPNKIDSMIDAVKTSKFSIYVETSIIPVQSKNTTTQLCYQGQLAILYNIKDKFQVGIFGQTLLYTGNYEIANIDNKIIELSSIEYNTFGMTIGYKFQFNKIILNPKLDFAYNFFLAKSLDFPNNKKEFLDYRYFSINPKINIGYAITDGFTLGLNLGYNKQIITFKGAKLEEFNPNSITTGLFVHIPIK